MQGALHSPLRILGIQPERRGWGLAYPPLRVRACLLPLPGHHAKSSSVQLSTAVICEAEPGALSFYYRTPSGTASSPCPDLGLKGFPSPHPTSPVGAASFVAGLLRGLPRCQCREPMPRGRQVRANAVQEGRQVLGKPLRVDRLSSREEMNSSPWRGHHSFSRRRPRLSAGPCSLQLLVLWMDGVCCIAAGKESAGGESCPWGGGQCSSKVRQSFSEPPQLSGSASTTGP